MAPTASLASSNAPEKSARHIRLLNASAAGKEALVREVLAEQQWTSQADADTLRLALVRAASKGSIKILQILLESGANVHPRREREQSPLFKAAVAGHLPSVLELLAHNADPNWQTEQATQAGQSALFRAAEEGHLPVVTSLLGRGADPNLRARNGQTAIYLACLRGHNAVVKALLEAGADANGGRVGDKDGRTPLLAIAAKKRPVDKVREQQKEQASEQPEKAVVKKVSAKRHLTETVPEKKVSGRPGKADAAEVSGKQNSTETNPEKKPREKKESTKKTQEKKSDRCWNLDTVKLLLQYGADPNAKDLLERTPLYWTAKNGHVGLARTLLAGGYRRRTDIEASQHTGRTALHSASESNKLEIVDLLLTHGAHVDPRSDGGWTPLINAAQNGHAGVVHKLLEANADVNALLSNHMTALHWAAFNGHEEVVEVLLKRADTKLTSKDHFDRTPMICAAENYHRDLVSRLSPARHAHRLSDTAREATKKFEATIVYFGDFKHKELEKLKEQKKAEETKPSAQKKKLEDTKPPTQYVFKETVYDLLYGFDDEGKPTVPVFKKDIKWQPDFRWIHLPSNNIDWIETLLAKFFVEDKQRDVEGFKTLSKCFDQEHRGPHAHANFMRPYCHCVPNRRVEREDSSLDSVAEQMDEQQSRLSSTLAGTESIATDLSEASIVRSAEAKRKSKAEQLAERHPPRQKRNKGPPGNPPGTREARLNGRTSSFAPSLASSEAFRQRASNGKMVVFMPFLHYETDGRRLKMADTIQRARCGIKVPEDASRDELLVHAYMNRSLHPRRTLDQYFYYGIDTSRRDRDQVVYRYCKSYRPDGEELKLFMVDSLWMWIMGDIVITCFPQRWDQLKKDPMDVVDAVVTETESNAKNHSRIQSIYELAMIITTRCTGIFDRHRVESQQFQFFDMFVFSIGQVTNRESELFDKFNEASRLLEKWLRLNCGGSEEQLELTKDLLDIHEETDLLAEIKDIQDELKILGTLLYDQLAVLDKFKQYTEQEMQVESNRKMVDPILKDLKQRFHGQRSEIDLHLSDIDQLLRQADDVKQSLTSLLDLKQKHSNALEARFAREHAIIAAKQAVISAKQGQTIMVFTIVTIIFLPMSFIAAFFAINFKEWDGQLSIRYVSKYMFGIGLAISFVFITAAILIHDISDAWKTTMKGIQKHIRSLFRTTAERCSEKNHDQAGVAIPSQQRPQDDDAQSRYHKNTDSRPDTSGGASTAYRPAGVAPTSRDGADWKSPVPGGLQYNNARLSRDREQRVEDARLRLPPRREHSDLSNGSLGLVRLSLNERRGRMSADLERGRDPSRSRVRWESVR